jgi:hypothetical protein
MSLSNRQKNIVNPFAEITTTESRNGSGYDYSLERNRFILDCIHEQYFYFYGFPLVGTILANINYEITEEDMLAYFALYPQNGKLTNGQATFIPDDEAIEVLGTIVQLLEDSKVLKRYTSNTSEESYEEEYQDPSMQKIANLIAIPPSHSKAYTNQLRSALRLPAVQYNEDVGLDQLDLDPAVAVYMSTDSNVDLYNWTQNGLPGEDNDRVYYNPVDSHYYYVKRTEDITRNGYSLSNILRNTAQRQNIQAAVNYWNQVSEDLKAPYLEAINHSIREILKFSQKNSDENYLSLQQLISPPFSYANADLETQDDSVFPLLSYKAIRPGSRWIYALKIPAENIVSLPVPASSQRPSDNEYQLPILEKAKRIIGPTNASADSISFEVLEMIRNLLPVRNALRANNDELVEQGLTGDILEGIDLEKEAVRLESFFELMEIFYNYNKIALEESDRIQMFFTRNYSLDHIVVNGNFYYHGCGSSNYFDTSNESASIINAFSLFTSTTFSIIRSTPQIYNDTVLSSVNTSGEPLVFLEKYVFPKLNLNALKVKRRNREKSAARRKSRRDEVFSVLANVTATSPTEYEKLWNKREKKFRVANMISGMDCNTGQARAAKYALKFYQAFYGRTRVASLIRETILLLKQEVVQDELAKRILSDVDTYNRNPDLFIRDVEKLINDEIFCGLDVMGDVIQTRFLDPKDDPPDKSFLSRKSSDMLPQFEFKKDKMISLKAKQSAIYRKAITLIIQNFIKSIVAGVIKDIVNAMFGCGPEAQQRDDSRGLKNISSKTNFGGSNLVEATSTLDLVDLAKQVPLYNVTTEEVDGITVQTRTSPNRTQIEEFLADVSVMCTPLEAQQLLDGDADYDLIEHILETASNDTVGADLEIRDYNSIEFSNQNITDFFTLLGDSLDFSLDEVAQNSPLAAYCENKLSLINNIDENEFTFNLEQQYTQIVNSKLDKINFLCDFLRGFPNLELELQRMFTMLPIMQYYDDLLIFIAGVSNGLTEKIASFFGDLFNQEEGRFIREKGEYNLYNSKMGTELFYQIFFPMRELTINQVYHSGFLTPSCWSHDRIGFRLRQGEDGIEWSGGSFGGRKNDQIGNNVYSKIWSDTRANVDIYREWQADPNRDISDDPPENALGQIQEVPRIGLPQFIERPQKQYDVWDSAYYAIRTAPDSLLPSIRRQLTRKNLALVGSLNDEGSRTQEERDFLSILGNEIEEYFNKRETTAPFVGWTGATYLKCRTSGVFINFWGPNLNPRVRGVTSNVVASYTPGQRNNLDADGAVNYDIFSGLQAGNNNISLVEMRNRDTGQVITQLNVNGVGMPNINSDGYKQIYGDISIRQGIARTAGTNTLCLQNFTRRIDEQINDSIIAGPGPERITEYINAVNLSPYVNSGDDCVTYEDITKADAGIRCIQARMFSFFLNVNPLTTSYTKWGSQGTINLVADYLYRKISEDLTQNNLIGSLYTTFDSISKVYGQNDNIPALQFNPVILSSNTPEQNLYNIIESMYVGTINNLGNTPTFAGINESAFTNQYDVLLRLLYTHLSDPGTDLAPYRVHPNRSNQIKEQIRQFIDEDGVTELGMLVSPYFMPIAFQIASYLIYMDRGIKYSERYSDTFMKSINMVGAADDGLLSAVKGQSIYSSSEILRNFPATVRAFEINSDITYYRPKEVILRIQQLNLYLGNFEDTLNDFFGIYDLDRLYEIQEAERTNITDTSLWENFLSLPRSTGERRQLRSRQREIIPEIDNIFNEWIGPDTPEENQLEPADAARLLQLRAEVAQLRIRLAATPPFGNARERLEQEIAALEQQIQALAPRQLMPFNYNRTLVDATQQANRELDPNADPQDQEYQELVRSANEYWKIILENQYKSIDMDILTPESYYDTVGNYFRLWGEFTQVRYETERGDRRGMDIPREVTAIKYAAEFLTFIGNTYDTGINIGPRLLREKTKLESLINRNE